MQSLWISQRGSSLSSWDFGQDSVFETDGFHNVGLLLPPGTLVRIPVFEIFEIPPSPVLPLPILHHRALVCPSSQQPRSESRASLLFSQEKSLAAEEGSPSDAHRAGQVQT